MDILSVVPTQAWMLVAGSIAITILVVGWKILKSKKVDIHVGKDGVDLEMSRSVTDTVPKPPPTTPNTPMKAINDSAERFMDLGK